MNFKKGDEVFEPRGMTIKNGRTAKVIGYTHTNIRVLLDVDPDSVWPDPEEDFTFHRDYGMVLSMKPDSLSLARGKRLDLI